MGEGWPFFTNGTLRPSGFYRLNHRTTRAHRHFT
jgi:hypothetical protein